MTPLVVPITRKHAHVVKIEQDGYHPIEASVVPVTSIWERGNGEGTVCERCWSVVS
jgi:hypothetical protein